MCATVFWGIYLQRNHLNRKRQSEKQQLGKMAKRRATEKVAKPRSAAEIATRLLWKST
jgi:hypothetical protein